MTQRNKQTTTKDTKSHISIFAFHYFTEEDQLETLIGFVMFGSLKFTNGKERKPSRHD